MSGLLEGKMSYNQLTYMAKLYAGKYTAITISLLVVAVRDIS